MQRTTAAYMARGLAGWNFKPEDYESLQAFAIVHATTQAHRPDGHVLIIRYPPVAGESVVAHASSRYGFTTAWLTPKKINKLKAHFRQTQGE